ncbi:MULTISPECIES: D-ribose pyranase [Mammaliicoccus]|uniref:D-ribose pyranase n=1 Tax=Mammaliicoccus fleurettii TaxID=150056 RepID=A0ABS5MNG2_9STAP|nr:MULTISPECIES: D-ribose pyranase [Mammaliicoccus]HCN59892.1 D-ribose pyranase [Staphylococcus sp.]MBL0846725.1 D-ribose pyranase [Mammaliicoccus fleurettii]MBO3061866.1 D-ribose pyranase [Mammaliicoccus fleurettii]MBS3672281.1 D-ribose pyranase [Mammaliicoccus fleurettii]MBS3697187.1 D-ribose pyranase [Mammaliicoccus fleurettii]
MYKTGILNSEISKVLSDLGHTDRIVIADCGLPIPKGVRKIDLALSFGVPSFESVYELVLEHMAVQKMIFAEEIKSDNPELLKKVNQSDVEKEYISHEKFKEMTRNTVAIIRTGEATPFANVILESDVLF